MTSVVLGIDTSGSHCSVALAADARLAHRLAEVGSAHAEFVLSMVDAVLTEMGMSLADCDAVAYAAGPGSFTGLRVGCAVAQGLAFGGAARLVPVGTLDAIADAIPASPRSRLLVAQDARMGEVYWGTFVRGTDRWIADVPPTLSSIADLLADGRARADLGVGNAWFAFGDRLSGLVAAVRPVHGANASDVARVGQRRFDEGETVAPDEATLLYVRDHVAMTTAERAARRADPAPLAEPV